MKARYAEGNRCIFTNKGVSGVTANDGVGCTINSVKPSEYWTRGKPEYVISLDNGNHFGCRECELEPEK